MIAALRVWPSTGSPSAPTLTCVVLCPLSNVVRPTAEVGGSAAIRAFRALTTGPRFSDRSSMIDVV